MALLINSKFTPRSNPPDANYPSGSIKNESVPGAKDGTPLDADWGNDYVGFDAALFSSAGITPSGNPDTVLLSDRLNAIIKILRTNYATIDVKAYGAQAATASDQSTIINNAAVDAASKGLKLTISPSATNQKNYRVDNSVIFSIDDLCVEFIDGAYLEPVDENMEVPLIIGGTTQPSRMHIIAPRVDRTTYNGTTENIGILYLEFNQSIIDKPESRFSKYNQVWDPTVGGSAYNVYINPQSIGGFYNFWMKEMGVAAATGFVNENNFVGGRGFTTANTDTNFRCEGGTNPYGTGHNRISTCLEGEGVQGIYDNGSSNQWLSCRSEGTWTGGSFHVFGPDCFLPLIISSRQDYTIDKSAAPLSSPQIIGYNNGSQFSTAINGKTVHTLENRSASGGSGLDVISNIDAGTAFAWRAMRLSDSLVRASCTTDGKMTVAKQFKNEQSAFSFAPIKAGTTVWWMDGSQYRVKTGSDPVSATDGAIIPQNQTSVAAGLGNIANIVNTTNKYTGKEVFDTGLNRPVWATGSTAGAIWVFSDGTTAYTPV